MPQPSDADTLSALLAGAFFGFIATLVLIHAFGFTIVRCLPGIRCGT